MAEKFPCEYGNKCYRENPAHFEEFSHPWEFEQQRAQRQSVEEEEPVKKRKRLKKAAASDDEETADSKPKSEEPEKKPKVASEPVSERQTRETETKQDAEATEQARPAPTAVEASSTTSAAPAPTSSPATSPPTPAPIFARAAAAAKAKEQAKAKPTTSSSSTSTTKPPISSFFAPRPNTKKPTPAAATNKTSNSNNNSNNSNSNSSSNSSSRSDSSSNNSESNNASPATASVDVGKTNIDVNPTTVAAPSSTENKQQEEDASAMVIDDMKVDDSSEEDEEEESGGDDDDKKESGKTTAKKVLPKKPLAAAAGVIPSIELNEKQLKEAIYWKPGQPVPFLVLAEMFSKLESTGSRLCNIRDASNVFRMIIASTPQDLTAAVYLTSATVAPAYAGIELGVGDQILLKALVEATGTQLPQLKQTLKEVGDIGLVAEGSRSGQRTLFPPPPLTIAGVFKTLREIGNVKGSKSGDFKKGKIKGMLVSCKGPEARYIVRSLQGNMRIGFSEKGVIAALGRAVALTPPSLTLPLPILDARQHMSREKMEEQIENYSGYIKQAFTEVPSYELLCDALLKYGPAALPGKCFLTPGIPVKVMLGKPAKGIQQVLTRFEDSIFTIEFKYDGERAQIHLCEDGSVKIYSRNSEDNTSKYPDLIALLPQLHTSETKCFIIDCEVVAWDVKESRILPFQTLSHRKKKDAVEEELQIQVCLFAFDLIYYNGKSYLNEQLAERRKCLRTNFLPKEGKFQFAQFKDTSDFEEIEEFMQLAIKSSCEGLMVKALEKDATYVPAKRNWLKLKKDYLDGLGDSLDLVPIAAFYGKGKRTGVFGAYLMAAYDEDTETYQSICKLGTGLKDEDLVAFTDMLKEHVIDAPRTYYSFPEGWTPDVWFDTVCVWEILCADLSISPVHKAAIGLAHPDKGIALRFPRFIRPRPDKKPENATSAEQVLSFYKNQAVVKDDKDEDD